MIYSGKERRNNLERRAERVFDPYTSENGNWQIKVLAEKRHQYDRRGQVTAEQLAEFIFISANGSEYPWSQIGNNAKEIRISRAQKYLNFIRGEK